jgi:hypothetical protein
MSESDPVAGQDQDMSAELRPIRITLSARPKELEHFMCRWTVATTVYEVMQGNPNL